jgi:hypothetical protein
MKIEIRTNNEKHGTRLKKYIPIIRRLFRCASKKYDIDVPEHLVLRPLRIRYNPSKYITHAIAGYSKTTGYYISLNMLLFTSSGYFECLILAHEVSHIVEEILTGQWTLNSSTFNEIYNYLETVARRKRCGKAL